MGAFWYLVLSFFVRDPKKRERIRFGCSVTVLVFAFLFLGALGVAVVLDSR